VGTNASGKHLKKFGTVSILAQLPKELPFYHPKNASMRRSHDRINQAALATSSQMSVYADF
jgi:hypothetical protein